MRHFSASWIGLCALLLLLGTFAGSGCAPASSQGAQEPPIALAIHGGAGTITRSSMTPEQEEAYRATLQEALEAGYAILKDGGTSLDAVVATIQVMEDSPLFNAGKGSVFTHEGVVEMDAAIMEGKTRNAGAIAGVQRIKNPITLARRVMEGSRHVMLTGAGAEAFAAQEGFEMTPNEYFHTDRRKQQLERAIQREQGGTAALSPLPNEGWLPNVEKFGTVGAVALDREGNLAAATSTGGMTNKRYGRVGDAPIIGAGTYADNATAAISATGHGEYFMRGVIAHDIAAMMRYGNASLADAANTVILDKLTEMGGTGGIIAVDHAGNVAMPFNTEGMYRGAIDKTGQMTVEIYKD